MTIIQVTELNLVKIEKKDFFILVIKESSTISTKALFRKKIGHKIILKCIFFFELPHVFRSRLHLCL